jgi:hypothetical protein
VTRVRDDAGNVVEENKYFIPTGKAISWKHLREFAEQIAW